MKPSRRRALLAGAIRAASRVLGGTALSAVLTLLLTGSVHAGWSSIAVPTDSITNPNPQLLDRSGNLWVSAYEGDFTFDGISWTRFRVEGHAARWSGVFADSSGNVWVPSAQWFDGVEWQRGSFRFDGATWHRLLTSAGLPHDVYGSGVVDREGNVWLSGNDAVSSYASRFDGTTWTDFETPSAGDLRFADSTGRLWFVGSSWVARFDGTEWVPFVTPTGVTVQTIAEDRAGTMWFTGRKTVHRLVGESFEDVTPTAFRRSNGTTNIVGGFTDREGILWVFQQFPSVLFSYERDRWRALTAEDGAPYLGRTLSAGFCDPSGAFWFGEGGSTIWRSDGELLRNVTVSDGLAITSGPDYYHPVAFCAANGDVWVINSGTEGAARYDGISWKHYSTADGLPGSILSMCQDPEGNIWFGSNANGVARFDGTTWTGFNSADGMGSNYVHQVLPDGRGGIWAIGQPLAVDAGYVDTLSHFDGVVWTTYTNSDSLPFETHSRAMTDRQGNLWCSAVAIDSTFEGGFLSTVERPDGLYRFDGSSWTHYTENVTSYSYNQHVWEDRAGRLWCGTEGLRLSRFDGTKWVQVPDVSSPLWENTFAEDRHGNVWLAAGLSYRYDGTEWAQMPVPSVGSTHGVLADRAGRVWFVNSYGTGGWTLATNYDGEHFRTFGSEHGISSSGGQAILSDSSGGLWISTGPGLIRYVPDRAAPVVAFVSKPPRRVPTGNLSASFRAAFEAGSFVEYSYRLDGGPWSAWSAAGSWAADRVPDGEHVLEVQGRDYVGNVSSFPLVVRFEVDATPPVPILSSPAFGTAVRGVATITGTAADGRFSSYRLEHRAAGSSTWAGAALIVESSAPVSNGALGTWDTTALPDGSYDVRLSITDVLGLVGAVIATVVVDNHAPYFDETAPAKVPAATGGDVYTTNAETHLYFPPHAFAQDAVVLVAASPAGSAPASLPSGGVRVLDGYELAWAGSLQKAARFTLSYAGAALPSGTLALYRSSDGSSWERLGGTVDGNAQSISLAISAPGRYALYADDGAGSGSASLSPLAFTPRVFSPTGGFADTQVGISFTLGKPAPVTVKVYSRSGRLIREVAAGQELSAGDNLIHWDGKDRDGGFVVDGVYLVTVEALGQTQTKSLAVVK